MGKGSSCANGFGAFTGHRKFRFGYCTSHYQTRGDSGIYIGVFEGLEITPFQDGQLLDVFVFSDCLPTYLLGCTNENKDS